jgi:hypothetical protein
LSLPWFTTLKLQTLPLFWARGPWGLVPRIDSPKQVTTRRGALSVLLRRRRHEGWQQPQHLMCWTWSFYDQYIYMIYNIIYIYIYLINDVMIMLWRFVVWNL